MDDIRTILKRVEVLPVSPSLLPKLLSYLSDVNANFDDVVKIISIDPALTAKLLQICNSAFFGQEEPISTVADAVNRVGYQSIYLLAAIINGSNSFPTPSPAGIDTGKLWKHSVSAAFNTKFCADSAGQDASLLFTAGLMHDIGKVVMARVVPVKTLSPFHLPSDADAIAKEKMALGHTHAEIGAVLMENWNLPPDLIACVRHHQDPAAGGEHGKLAACVAIGSALAHSPDHPRVLDTAEFKGAMTILKMDSSHLKRWHRQFDDAQDLIAGMSRLPL